MTYDWFLHAITFSITICFTIEVFNSTSRYFNEVKILLLIRKHNFYLNLSISNDTVCTKIYDKRDDFDFDIQVNFPFP